MSVLTTEHNTQFMAGGGEMGNFIRSKDWTKTPLGPLEGWPQSLRTTISILLNSKFPMFLWWGDELTCFYNDAYRPSLGKNGKHPGILGICAREAWPEIWDTIKPLIDQVLSGGESIWREDQLIAIYRNGKIEDVYWTFSYSPVNDETGKVAGVLVICSETTEKINSFKILEDSNRRYINNVMQAPVAMCIFRGKDHVVEIANGLMLEVWGKKSEDVLNKPIFEGLPEAKGQGLEQLIDGVLNTGERYVAYERPVNLPRNGKIETTYINLVYEALKDPNGTISGIIAIAYEVTLQVVARKKVEESEEKFQAAVLAVQGILWTNNAKGEMEGNQPGWELLTGQSYNDYQGYGWTKVVHPEDVQSNIDAWQKAVSERTTFVHEHRLRLKNGEWGIFSIRSIPLVNADGSVRGWVGVHTDITAQRLSETSVKESEQKFRLLADSMPQYVWTADPRGNFNYYNQSIFNYSGLNYEQIRKDGWLQIVHPDDREENLRTWKDSLQTGKDFLFEHRFRSINGEYRWQLSRAIPQRDAAGKIQMWVGTSTDIEEQKSFTNKLEKKVEERTRQLEQKNKELQLMNSELQSFAYVSSHDLQEPLRKIQTFASRILEKEQQQLSESGKDYFKRMQDAAKRMQTLIEDLLAYSRTNTADRNFQKTDLNKIVEQVKSELNEDIEQKHATIEATPLFEAKIIPFQFRQLVHNLIGNSIKFSKPGYPPHIVIKSKIVEGATLNFESISPYKMYYHLSFSDNGIGFDPQYKDRIFEVFQRLHGKDEFKGTGIGLAIVKKIVENHNGIITANSELDKGATFDIYFPECCNS